MKKTMLTCSCAGAGLMMAIGMSITSYAAGGWRQEGDNWRYYQNNGDPVTETWKKSGDSYFYLGSDGHLLRSQLIEYEDNYYYVDSSGARVTNQWRKLPNEDPGDDESDEAWYYFQSNGRACKAPESGKTSFRTLKTSTGEGRYAFDSEGRMLFGWVNDESQRLTGDDAWKEGIYYCGDEDDGAMVRNQWRRLEASDDDNHDDVFDDEYWFYFQSNGKKAANTKKNINGYKYLFHENGNAAYQWQSTPSNAATSSNVPIATKSSYYKRPDQCYMALGWFLAVPSEEADPQAYHDDEEHWFYGLSNGGVVTSQLKTIKGQTYGFNESGIMLHGLYKAEIKDKQILSYEKIESERDFPASDEKMAVYYFGDKPKAGVMATGKCTISLDGENYTYFFKTSGADRGAGAEGIYDGAIYEKGRLLTIESGMRYGTVTYQGKQYLVSQSGKIQKGKRNIKDSDGVYYSSDKNGIVTHYGDKQ